MAKERYVDADALIQALYKLPQPYFQTPYNSSQLDSALMNMITESLRQYHMNLTASLASAIINSATASPCMLCKKPETDELPPNNYAG